MSPRSTGSLPVVAVPRDIERLLRSKRKSASDLNFLNYLKSQLHRSMC
jgi:hypothetical protein